VVVAHGASNWQLGSAASAQADATSHRRSAEGLLGAGAHLGMALPGDSRLQSQHMLSSRRPFKTCRLCSAWHGALAFYLLLNGENRPAPFSPAVRFSACFGAACFQFQRRVLTWMIILKTERSVSDQTEVSYDAEALLLLNAVCLIASCDAGALFKFASVMHIISYSCRQLLYHDHC